MGGKGSRNCCETDDTETSSSTVTASSSVPAKAAAPAEPGQLQEVAARPKAVRARSAAVSSEDSLELLLEFLESDAADIAEAYRKLLLKKDSDETRKTQAHADEVIARVLLQLGRVKKLHHRRRTWHPIQTGHADTWGEIEENDWTQMFEGKRRDFKNLRDIAQKVRKEISIVKHWQDVLSRDRREGNKQLRKQLTNEIGASGLAEKISDWHVLDVFELEEATRKPLAGIFMSIWIDRKFNNLCKVTKDQAFEYIHALESEYKDKPYHNRIHAADVTATSYYLMSNFAALEGMEGYVRDVDIYVLMLAASCHDVGHPGLNNDFLARTSDPLALRYNDRSILENYHVATAFGLMSSLNIPMLQHNLPSPPVAALRSRIIDMVLATDMAHHKGLYEELVAELAENHHKMQDVNKITLEKNLLHSSDIGHPLRPFSIHLLWSERISEEFLVQGDQEKLQGIEPIALFDRDKAPPLPKGQIGFINFVVLPTWKPLNEALGQASAVPDYYLEENAKKWEELAQSGEDPFSHSEPLMKKQLSEIVGRRAQFKPAVKYTEDAERPH